MSQVGDGRLEDVYQAVILDHSRNPRNVGAVAGATHQARGDNPFCGDRFSVSLAVADARVAAVGVEGAGCALSTASASLMSERVRGLTATEIEQLARRFDGVLAGTSPGAGTANGNADADAAALGELTAFAAVARFPVRVKCARLPWKTLLAALAGAPDPVSTER